MATTTDELLVKVSVDSTGAVKGFKIAEQGTKTLGDAIKKSEELAKSLDKQFGILAASAQKMKGQFDSQAKTMSLVAGSVREVSSVFVAQIREQGQLANGFKNSGQWALKAAENFRLSSQALTGISEAAAKGANGDSFVAHMKSLAEAENARVAETKAAAEVTQDGSEKLTIYGHALQFAGVNAIVLNQALELLKKGFGAVAAVAESTVGAFIEQERAEKLLSNALKINGAQSADAMDQFKQFADALQDTTTVSDQTALSLIAMAKASGTSDEMAKKLVTTAVDMGATFNKDVNEPFEALLASLKGQAEGLSKYDIHLKDLSEGAARAGAGVNYLSKSLAGMAQGDAKTLGGSLVQLKNQFSALLTQVGGAIVDVFMVPAGVGALKSALKALGDVIASTRDRLRQFADAVRSIDVAELAKSLAVTTASVIAFAAAWQAWNFALAIQAIGGVGKALAAMGGLPVITANIRAMAAAWTANTVAMAASTAELAIIAVALAGVATAIETVGRNLDNLPTLFSTVWRSMLVFVNNALKNINALVAGTLNVLESALSAVEGTVADVGGVASAALEKIRNQQAAQVALNDELEKIYQKQSKVIIENRKNLDNTTLISQLTGFFDKLTDTTKGAAAETAKVTSPPDNGNWKRLLETIRSLRDENMQMGTEIAAIGSGQVAQIQVALAGDIQRINAKREQLAVEGMLSSVTRGLLADQEKIANIKAQALIDDARLQSLKELANETTELAADVRAQSLGQIGLIDAQTEAEMRKLAMKELELAVDGKLTDSAQELIDKQRTLFKERGEAAKKNAKSTVSNDQVEQITAGFGAGAGKAAKVLGSAVGSIAGPVGAAMTVVNGALDFVQQLIDFIPQLLEKIGNIFNSLTDLPSKLAKGFGSLVKGLINFTTNFVPNVLQQIPTIINTILDGFLEKIPAAANTMLEKLPDMVSGLADKLPDMVDKFISGFISSIPRLGAAFVVAVVKGAPKIALTILKLIYVELPKAIIKGIVDGIKQAADAFTNLFSGKGMKVDTKGIQNVIDGIGKQATGVADNVFKVLDLAAAAKGMSLSDQIRDAIDSATGRTKNIFQQIFDGLKKVWEKIFAALTAAWDFIFNMLKTVWNGLMAAFQPIVDALVAVWHFVYDTVVKSLELTWSTLKMTWDVVLQSLGVFVVALKGAWDIVLIALSAWVEALKVVWSGLINILSIAWQGIQGIWQGMMNVLSAYWDGIKAIWNGMLSLLTGAWDTVKALWQVMMDLFSGKISILDALKQSFAVMFDSAVKAFSTVWDTAQKVFNSFANALNAALATATGLFENFGRILSSAWDTASSVFAVFTNALSTAWSSATTTFNSIYTKLSGIGQTAFDWVKTNIIDKLTSFKWPTFTFPTLTYPKFTWPALPTFDTAAIGSNIASGMWNQLVSLNLGRLGTDLASGVWNQLVALDISRLGADMAIGLWNKLITFDFGKLIGGGGGGKIAGLFATGGMVPHYAAAGDMVSFRPRGTDTVPYMLTPGEFVVSAPAVRSVGTDFMNSLNRGQVPAATAQHVTYDVSVSIENKAPLDEEFVKRKLVPLFIKELNFQSQNGRGIIDVKGLRK